MPLISQQMFLCFPGELREAGWLRRRGERVYLSTTAADGRAADRGVGKRSLATVSFAGQREW